MTDMTGKTVLITGGTGGIGQESAIGIAKLGAQVIVTGRNEKRAKAGVEVIKQTSGSDNIQYLIGDMASFSGVRQLAQDFIATYDQLDVLVNNVGYLSDTHQDTVDGYETVFAVNVLAPLLFTHLLLPSLKKSSDPRVLTITGGQNRGSIDFDDLQGKSQSMGLGYYSKSKVMMEATQIELAKRLEQTDVKVYVAYPGPANTAMTQGVTRDTLPGFLSILYPLFRWFIQRQDPEKAAISTIHVASTPNIATRTGLYFDTNANIQPFNAQLTADVTKRMYDLSMDMIGWTEVQSA